METRLQVRSFDSRLSPEEFREVPRNPVYPILDNLRSAFNVGSVIRTADCILAEKICLCGYTAHPPHKKLDKTSLGALPYVPWAYYETTSEAIRVYKDLGVPVVALELTNRSRLIWEYRFPLPVALVLGNEALGVSHEALAVADDILEIPMLGYKNSINVAVAFGIAAYEIQRQHWQRFVPQLASRKGEGEK
ncbi:MAG TPA: TrmH family RNA methyltransferase [bacterium]|nr:TrmH family RNA methyltransferase [bacterium]